MSHETTTQPATPVPPLPSAGGNCDNCGAPLYGKYCYACGQPTTGMVRHFSSVMSDIADSVLNIDERVFKTLVPLYLRPGKLTLDYFAGRRARYVTPFRLVFFLAIVAFFAAQITVRAGYGHLPAKAISISTDSGKPTVSVVPTPGQTRAPVSSDDSTFAHGNLSFGGGTIWNRDTKPLRIGWLPNVVTDSLNDLIGNAQQQLYAMSSGSWTDQQNARRKFSLGMFAAAPTVLFVLLPVFALMLKIFYIFKKRLYMEHLIVAMHSHAFLMMSVLVLVVLSVLRRVLQPHAGWLAVPFDLLDTATWIWIFVYLWLMQKRVYRQGWFMTNVKYWSLGFCYTILLGFGFVFVALLSLTGA
ncbi:MAG TPA: DUF3667 domain-containing protein [Rhodanobacteraceae bacterium]|nr:DUF3667 domain-containing protein [Rhodanobacteraceae bacterium]